MLRTKIKNLLSKITGRKELVEVNEKQFNNVEEDFTQENNFDNEDNNNDYSNEDDDYDDDDNDEDGSYDDEEEIYDPLENFIDDVVNKVNSNLNKREAFSLSFNIDGISAYRRLNVLLSNYSVNLLTINDIQIIYIILDSSFISLSDTEITKDFYINYLLKIDEMKSLFEDLNISLEEETNEDEDSSNEIETLHLPENNNVEYINFEKENHKTSPALERFNRRIEKTRAYQNSHNNIVNEVSNFNNTMMPFNEDCSCGCSSCNCDNHEEILILSDIINDINNNIEIEENHSDNDDYQDNYNNDYSDSDSSDSNYDNSYDSDSNSYNTDYDTSSSSDSDYSSSYDSSSYDSDYSSNSSYDSSSYDSDYSSSYDSNYDM